MDDARAHCKAGFYACMSQFIDDGDESRVPGLQCYISALLLNAYPIFITTAVLLNWQTKTTGCDESFFIVAAAVFWFNAMVLHPHFFMFYFEEGGFFKGFREHVTYLKCCIVLGATAAVGIWYRTPSRFPATRASHPKTLFLSVSG
jgi:hypothetical protein